MRRATAGTAAFAGLAVLIVLGFAFGFGSGPGRSIVQPPSGAPSALGDGSPPAATAAASDALVRELYGVPVPAASHGPFPPVLRGTSVDGGVELDAGGHFRPTPSVLRLFDYFLLASGQEPDDVIRGRILLHLAASVPEPAATEVAELLVRYWSLREAGRALHEAGAVPEGLDRRLQWLRELRREHLGPELAAALYGEQEQVTLLDLERRDVLLDDTLDEAERAERLAAIDERLPERVRSARARSTLPARVRADVQSLRAAGADEAEIRALREHHFGPEAAERLAELDERRALFYERLETYRAERDRLRSDPSLAEDDLAAELDALRREHFAEEELARVRALDAYGS